MFTTAAHRCPAILGAPKPVHHNRVREGMSTVARLLELFANRLGQDALALRCRPVEGLP